MSNINSLEHILFIKIYFSILLSLFSEQIHLVVNEKEGSGESGARKESIREQEGKEEAQI